MNTPPNELHNWLTYPLSLTEKLKQHTGEATLTVIQQAWSNSGWWHKYRLKIDEPVMQREIVMSSHGHACWYARTVIPESTYLNNDACWDILKQAPLGVLIFDTKQIQRKSLTHSAIDKRHLEYYFPHASLTHQSTSLWMRYSHLLITEPTPLYLFEIFLPDMLKII